MLILASNSPRRKVLLEKITRDFIIKPSNYSEPQKDLPPTVFAVDCALNKAEDVYSSCKNTNSNITVLAADTIVVLNGKILGKPKGAAEAVQMLNSLSDSAHEVITGICIKTDSATVTDYEITTVEFEKLSAQEIDDYIATGSPFDKAGAYGLQDKEIRAKIRNIIGSEDNVIGLPAELVRKYLAIINYKI